MGEDSKIIVVHEEFTKLRNHIAENQSRLADLIFKRLKTLASLSKVEIKARVFLGKKSRVQKVKGKS